MAERPRRTTEQKNRPSESSTRRSSAATSPKSMEINTLFVLGGFTLALHDPLRPGQRAASALDLRGFLMNAHHGAAGRRRLCRRRSAARSWPGSWRSACRSASSSLGGSRRRRRPAPAALDVRAAARRKFSRISPMSGLQAHLRHGRPWSSSSRASSRSRSSGPSPTMVLVERARPARGFAQISSRRAAADAARPLLKLLGGVLAVSPSSPSATRVYQRFAWLKRQRMSKRELKEEFKETEGNPEIKAQAEADPGGAGEAAHDGGGAEGHRDHHQPDPLRGGAEIRARHGGAGLRRQGRRRASRLRIRAVASEHRRADRRESAAGPRACTRPCEIDQEIPVEHYKAVAEVIGYVLRLRRRPS